MCFGTAFDMVGWGFMRKCRSYIDWLDSVVQLKVLFSTQAIGPLLSDLAVHLVGIGGIGFADSARVRLIQYLEWSPFQAQEIATARQQTG